MTDDLTDEEEIELELERQEAGLEQDLHDALAESVVNAPHDIGAHTTVVMPFLESAWRNAEDWHEVAKAYEAAIERVRARCGEVHHGSAADLAADILADLDPTPDDQARTPTDNHGHGDQ